MVFDLDPDSFADILCEPASSNARAGTKFQPKAKPRPKKETTVSSLINAAKEKPVTTASSPRDTSQSVFPSLGLAEKGWTRPPLSCVDSSTIMPCSASKLLETQEAIDSNEVLHPRLSQSDGDRNSAPVVATPQLAVTKEDVGSTDTPHSEVTISDIHGDLQTADIFSELESLDDILSQSTTANLRTMRKFQPRVELNARPRNKLPTLHLVTTDAEGSIPHSESPNLHASNNKDIEEGPSFPILSSVNSTFRACSSVPTDTSPELLVSQEPVHSREATVSDSNEYLRMDNGRSGREEAEAFPGLESHDIISEATTTTGDAQFTPSETEYLDGDSTPVFPPDGCLDLSTMRLCDSAPIDPPSELPVTEELTHIGVASGLDATIPDKVADSEAIPVMSEKKTTKSRKRKTSIASGDTARMVHSGNAEGLSQGIEDETPVLATGMVNEIGKSSRQLRKRLAARDPADETEDGRQENGDLLAEISNNSLMDEDDNNDDDDDYRGEETSHRKRAPRRYKRSLAENEGTVQRRKKTSEGSEPLNKKPLKKKFSHTSRRNKRQVDKILLEVPEDEINPQKLMIKDLIMLAEAKERISNKDAMASKKSFPSQSVNNSFAQDTPYDEDDPYASREGLNPGDDEATPEVQPSSSKLNYHSFMDRTPTERWSKQDTELFYEAIRQFGTDFAMIQQLFPGRTRHQVKLKYKKEERQHPLKLSDALTNRSKDHSHFELVIERLQQATAQAEENNRDVESAGVTGEEEEITPETNEEVMKMEQEEVAAKDSEVEVPEVHSPVKSPESEDDVYRWSQYKSDYDVF